MPLTPVAEWMIRLIHYITERKEDNICTEFFLRMMRESF